MDNIKSQELLLEALNGFHINKYLCSKGEESKYHRLAMEEAHASTETVFQVYGWPLIKMVSFKYLRHLLTSADDNWP